MTAINVSLFFVIMKVDNNCISQILMDSFVNKKNVLMTVGAQPMPPSKYDKFEAFKFFRVCTVPENSIKSDVPKGTLLHKDTIRGPSAKKVRLVSNSELYNKKYVLCNCGKSPDDNCDCDNCCITRIAEANNIVV